MKRRRKSTAQERRKTRYHPTEEQLGALMKFMYATMHNEPIPEDARRICEDIFKVKQDHPK